MARGGRTLFSGLDLALVRGEWAAATGPSGCGKTSLGDALLGLRPPAAGRVRRSPGAARTAFQKAYQDPLAAFAPHVSLRTALDEAARLHGVAWLQVGALLALLREVSAERGLAVLLVTHDAAMAAKMAGPDRVLALGDDGAQPPV